MINGMIFVCADCFGDPGIKDFIEGAKEGHQCSFCGNSASEPIAAPFDDVIDHMKECLKEYYDYAANNLPYESAEGGYIGDHWDSYDLVTDELELSLPNDQNGDLFHAVVDEFGQEVWCEANPFSLSENQRLRFSWDEFCRLIKQEQRFFFLNHHRNLDDELADAAGVLGAISHFAERTDLFSTLPKGQHLFRARYKKPNQSLERVLDLGPPPIEHARQSNRMSPPGIVMFYVSDNPETALRETAIEPASFVVGEFQTTRDIKILDLVDLPSIPSMFHKIPDSMEINPRNGSIFLHEIAADISKPIARDDRVHVEYVPTQVVTEYFRTLQPSDGIQIDGIRYRSSHHIGHSSMVLFADQTNLMVPDDEKPDDFYPSEDIWISLVGSEEVSVSNEMIDSWPS